VSKGNKRVICDIYQPTKVKNNIKKKTGVALSTNGASEKSRHRQRQVYLGTGGKTAREQRTQGDSPEIDIVRDTTLTHSRQPHLLHFQKDAGGERNQDRRLGPRGRLIQHKGKKAILTPQRTETDPRSAELADLTNAGIYTTYRSKRGVTPPGGGGGGE